MMIVIVAVVVLIGIVAINHESEHAPGLLVGIVIANAFDKGLDAILRIVFAVGLFVFQKPTLVFGSREQSQFTLIVHSTRRRVWLLLFSAFIVTVAILMMGSFVMRAQRFARQRHTVHHWVRSRRLVVCW
jgi:hypothetical protein